MFVLDITKEIELSKKSIENYKDVLNKTNVNIKECLDIYKLSEDIYFEKSDSQLYRGAKSQAQYMVEKFMYKEIGKEDRELFDTVKDLYWTSIWLEVLQEEFGDSEQKTYLFRMEYEEAPDSNILCCISPKNETSFIEYSDTVDFTYVPTKYEMNKIREFL